MFYKKITILVEEPSKRQQRALYSSLCYVRIQNISPQPGRIPNHAAPYNYMLQNY